MLVVNPSTISGKSFTDIRTVSSIVPSADTAANTSTTTNDGAVVSQHGPTARKYLAVMPRTTSPFINAQLINTETDLIETLTVSGALSGSLAGAYNYDLTYSDEQSSWYLMVGNNIYPLTLSGTTLTIGASFTGPSQGTMTGDKTDLYWLDMSGTDTFTHRDLSGATNNVLTPPLTYLSTGLVSTRTAGRIRYSNGKIYMIGSYDGQATNEFQVYDIAGDSWTRLPLPPTKTGRLDDCILITDPDDNTHIWLYTGPSGLLNRMPQLLEFETAGESWTTRCFGSLLPGPLRDLTTDTTRLFQSFFSVNDSMSSGVADISNGDIITVLDINSSFTGTMDDVCNWGDNRATTILDYTGSGEFLGASAPMAVQWATSNQSSSPVLNAFVTLRLTIDGSSVRTIQLGGLDPDITSSLFSVKFSTSLKIDVLPIGGPSAPNSGEGSQVFAYIGINS